MITVICIYNHKNILEECLINSLNNQTIKYESIFIDNSNNKYSSAAKALNHNVKKAHGEYLMFVHQDIVIEEKDWLERVESTLNNLNNVGVMGVAGSKEYDVGIFSNIRHGVNKIYAGNHRINELTKVQTVDECLFIVPKNVCNKIEFDENNCYSWHLYAADFCIQTKLAGYDVYVYPTEIYHKSPGASMNISYYFTIKKLYKKYKDKLRFLRTSCSEWDFNIFYLKYYYRIIRFKIISILEKGRVK